MSLIQRHFRAALLMLAACLLPLWAQAQDGAKSVVSTEQVRAELMAYAPDGVAAGKPVWIGLQLAHQPHWHTYWKNAGDSGLATSLSWTLQPGVLADDIAWPVPQKLPIGNLVNYGYEGTVLLPVPLSISPDFKPAALQSELEIALHAKWLVCKIECVPQDGQFALRLPLKGSTALNAAEFKTALAAQPAPLNGAANVRVEGHALKLEVTGLPAALQGKTLDFFPETSELIEPAGHWTQSWQGAQWSATVPLSAYRSTSPDTLPLVLVADVGGTRSGFRAEAPISGTWPAKGSTPATPVAASAAPVVSTSLPPSLWLALLGALLGGMILNLMPCVFPVLAIKVVGFTRKPGARHSHRVQGLAYTAGVVLSFLALGALMLALRNAGQQLGWGFQLQSPAVVATLAALFTVIGLNLAGLFEFEQMLSSRIATLEAKNPAVNAFLSGMLAVLIASPCTAPFMGASLGLALTLPALQALLVFVCLGTGMALPYLAASWSPALARQLPKPGAWMATFRHAMAFPMFGTVVWLVWVLGQQTGIDGATALLALLVGLTLVIWALGLHGRARWPLATLALVVLVALGWGLGRNLLHPIEAATLSAQGERWQPWAPGKVDELLAAGSPVFVDFTAAWCVTCQYNKKTTLVNAEVLAAFDAKQVRLLRADWTRSDPAITAALAQLGRNGVPVYVLYQNGHAPVLLNEILSVNEVKAALATL